MGLMLCCDKCDKWLHGKSVGIWTDEEVPVSPPRHEAMVGLMDPDQNPPEPKSESFNESLKLETSFDPEDARQAVIALEEKIQSMITK